MYVTVYTDGGKKVETIMLSAQADMSFTGGKQVPAAHIDDKSGTYELKVIILARDYQADPSVVFTEKIQAIRSQFIDGAITAEEMVNAVRRQVVNALASTWYAESRRERMKQEAFDAQAEGRFNRRAGQPCPKCGCLDHKPLDATPDIALCPCGHLTKEA